MMWEVITGNPPYAGNLHLKIINTVIQDLEPNGVASFIHPARWYQDPLAEFKKGSDKKKFKDIVERLDDVKLIDNKTCNKKFNISLNGELMISKILGKPTGEDLNLYDGIPQKTVDAILKYSKEHNLAQVDDIKKVDGWRCQINDIIVSKYDSHNGDNEYSRKTGCNLFALKKNNVFLDGFNEDGVEWMNTVNKNKYEKPSGSPFPHSIKFDTKEEALNFQSSCNTNFYCNIMYLLKLDMNTPLQFLPWMEDYSHPWTDEDYCKFFGDLGMSKECQKWMCRDVYDYRIKDFIDYEKFDERV